MTKKYEEFKQNVSDRKIEHRAALSSIWKQASEIKRDQDLNDAQKHELLNELYGVLSTKDIHYTTLNDVLPHQIGTSFRSSVTYWRLLKQRLRQMGLVIGPASNPKLIDRKFAAALGVPTPRTYVYGKKLHEVPLNPKSVIKPIDGDSAQGVFFVGESLSLTSFKTGHTYPDLIQAENELKDRSLANKKVWLAEEAILNENGKPAHDMKVYMFYGEVGVIQEIQRAGNDGTPTRYCHYYPDGSTFSFGGMRKLFEGTGFDRKLLDLAKIVSLQIPMPFARIDFHAGDGSYFLGEITAHPGGTQIGEITDLNDKYLGRLYLDAESRLYADLLDGKDFSTYINLYSNR